MTQGKREFVRIPVAVKISFNIVSSRDKEKIIESINKGEEDSYKDVASFSKLIMEKHKLQETKEVNPILLELLVYIKKKLEEIEEMVRTSCEVCFQHKATTNDLGGGGLSFLWNEELQEGSLLDIFIHIPLFPKSGIRTLGKVVKCTKEESGFMIRVAFEFIKEDDREDIIKFVFIKQREMLARRSLGRG